MDKKPSISVCMPMYNASKFLRECMDSVLTQTFGDFEFLIVDDGSTDDSVEIVRSYHDSRMRLIRNRHDYIGSLNMLLDEARGKYIARMDADDVMRRNRLSIQFDFLEKNNDTDIVCGEIDYWGDNSNCSGLNNESEITLELMMEGNVVPHPTVMMRTCIIPEKNLHYNDEYVYAEDYNLWVDALAANLRIVQLHQVLIDYRLSNTQISSQKRKEKRASSDKVVSQEGQLRGGFNAFGAASTEVASYNENCDCNCTCDGNGNCNCNCGCSLNKNCRTCTPFPTPTATPKPTGVASATVLFGSSILL